MPGITFVFGPNGSFFFDSPTAWKFDCLPGTLRQLFNLSMAPAWRIAQPYCVALAPQINSPEPLWYIGCRVMTGEDKLLYSQTYFENIYTDLVRWTKTLPNASSACFVTFGLNLSYFACAPGSGSIWAGIPSELEDKVRKSFETPTCVALGSHDAWFVLWPNGDFSWKFNGHYNALDKILTEAAPQSVSYVAISQYNKHHYFVAFRDQSIKYDFTGAPPEWMKLMTEVFDAWRAERLQKPQQQYFPPAGNTYPHVQPRQPPQPQQQAAYYCNNTVVSELLSVPAHILPVSPPLTPNMPLTGYPSPALSQAVPNNPFACRPPPQGAIEMPVELPGSATLAAPASASARTISTEVNVPVTIRQKKKRFKLF
ncbi:uncharacterized protein M421DRAFT_415243 [Didymella exigua CBS 183.55]|uniref:Uncharacterized protein n=1 Tax=Didymella exigua CBS 183.55 TaxID=1150837 RepID=A0A6A5S424_9PLEO|nr:uncharacterized protein M421DRAFT_415243 [Didymella exigua CBS 183.55]KAF1934194.1 hypothetical protein M421DRAFT_415243 [Didymella exigua CBS 183.55]